MKIKIGLVGANGFIGLELIRLIASHPDIEIKYIFKHKKKLEEEFNHLRDFGLDKYQTTKIDDLKDCDCVFLSLPQNESSEYLRSLFGKTKIIDLGSDNRILNQKLYRQYYDGEFNEDINSQFVYGFLEKNKSIIQNAKNVSNPGCFALCVQMSILPIFKQIKSVDIFAITGSSGGGKAPIVKNHHSIRSKDIFSYNINKHRHLAEIFQSFPNLNLSNFTFVPTSGPFVRGIFLNSVVELKDDIVDEVIEKNYKNFINENIFIRKQEEIKLSNVVGSNFFDLNLIKISNTKFIIQSCLDNLIKGAAGNSIECMNVMFGLRQDEGLKNLLPVYI